MRLLWKSGANLIYELLIFAPGPICTEKKPFGAKSNCIFHYNWEQIGSSFWLGKFFLRKYLLCSISAIFRPWNGSKLDHKCKFWERPEVVKNWIFKKIFKRTTSGQNFRLIHSYLLELFPIYGLWKFIQNNSLSIAIHKNFE